MPPHDFKRHGKSSNALVQLGPSTAEHHSGLPQLVQLSQEAAKASSFPDAILFKRLRTHPRSLPARMATLKKVTVSRASSGCHCS